MSARTYSPATIKIKRPNLITIVIGIPNRYLEENLIYNVAHLSFSSKFVLIVYYKCLQQTRNHKSSTVT